MDAGSPCLEYSLPLLNLQASLRLLGDRIREARKARGLSQEDLAHEAELDRSYMGGIERGQQNPSFKTLCAIAETLHTDVGSLIEGLPIQR